MEKLSHLLNGSSAYALLEDSKSTPKKSKNLLFTKPSKEIIAWNFEQLPTALKQIEKCKNDGLYLCGYLAYEAGYYFLDKKIKDTKNSKQPLLYFIAFKQLGRPGRNKINDSFDSVALADESQLCIHDLKLNVTEKDYIKSIAKIKQYIEAGDTYQVNYTIKYKFKLQGAVASLYKVLRQTQPVEFGALLNFPESKIVSLSPELFIKKKRLTLTSKPMKGTAKRGKNVAEDKEIIKFLKSDPKTLSENVMIVDLIRNDFGRICETGSVRVKKLFQVQTFKTIHQMISTVKGTLKKDLSFTDILHALFPCGSITGAPKIRTMEIINDLELEARGIYTGAIGYLMPDDDFYFNVPIRTISVNKNKLCEMGIGSGIICESNAKDEFEECLLKADFLTHLNRDFYLIEAFRFEAESGTFVNFQQHLARLSKSARYFGFKFNKLAIKQQLAKIKKSLMSENYKVRLTAFQNGEVKISHSKIEEDDNLPKTVIISSNKIDSSSIFQYHKTSRREHYNRGFERATNAGHYEVIFLNERDQVAEASRHNVFIKEGDEYSTPPLSTGILDGIYRQQFMQENKVTEAVISKQRLINCDEILLTNSVRGAVSVNIEDQ